MAARYSYLALEDDQKLVTEWFAALDTEMTVNERDDRTVYYFRALAKHPLPRIDEIDQEKTPLVFVVPPMRLRGTLWSDAEVLFTPTSLREQFPILEKIRSSFAKWLKEFDLIYSPRSGVASEWNYYLEAGIQNFATEVYALPGAMAALRSGQYFVHHRATPGVLDVLAKSLRLRGYPVEDDLNRSK